MAKVLVIGLDPEVIDFSQPVLRDAGLNADKILAGLRGDQQKIRELGHEAAVLLVDDGATAERVVRDALAADPPDIIVIGAGVRTLPAYFLLFEKLINAVHQAAPQAKIAFNTNPADTADAVERWVGGEWE